MIFSKGHNKTKSVNEINGDLTYKLKQNRKTFQNKIEKSSIKDMSGNNWHNTTNFERKISLRVRITVPTKDVSVLKKSIP